MDSAPAQGLLLSVWVKDLLLAVSPADFPRAAAVNIDWRVLLFSLLLTPPLFFLLLILTAPKAAPKPSVMVVEVPKQSSQ